MAISKKVYLCSVGENDLLNTGVKWIERFKKENFQNNIVALNIESSEYSKVTNIQEELDREGQTGIQKEYLFLIVEKTGTCQISGEEKNYVSGYFAKSNRYLSSLVNMENGEISDQSLRLGESASTVSRFVFFIEENILYYEYNRNGVGYFDGRFYRYLDTLFGEDSIMMSPVMFPLAMGQAINANIMKKMELRVAASNVDFVDKLIGLTVSQRFKDSLGPESYNITVIVSSNRTSHLGERFVTGVLDKYSGFRRKEEVKKLVFKSDSDEPYELTKELRYKLEELFETVSPRSKRITEESFRGNIITHYNDKKDEIFGAIE